MQLKHGNSYDIPRLRLWSRMICSNIHNDSDNAPSIPVFTSSSIAKKAKRIHLLML